MLNLFMCIQYPIMLDRSSIYFKYFAKAARPFGPRGFGNYNWDLKRKSQLSTGTIQMNGERSSVPGADEPVRLPVPKAHSEDD